MDIKALPIVSLRELHMEDVGDRYRWFLDKEVTKHLNLSDTYPPFTKEKNSSMDRNVY